VENKPRQPDATSPKTPPKVRYVPPKFVAEQRILVDEEDIQVAAGLIHHACVECELINLGLQRVDRGGGHIHDCDCRCGRRCKRWVNFEVGEEVTDVDGLTRQFAMSQTKGTTHIHKRRRQVRDGQGGLGSNW
jgi:hypothetical protein